MKKVYIQKGETVTTLVTDNAGYLKFGENCQGLSNLIPNQYTDFETDVPTAVESVSILSFIATYDIPEYAINPATGFIVSPSGEFFCKIVP